MSMTENRIGPLTEEQLAELVKQTDTSIEDVAQAAARLGQQIERERYRDALRKERNRAREQIGWQLVPLYRAEGMVTQAFLSCARCRATLDTVGGPSMDAYCETCAAAIRSEP